MVKTINNNSQLTSKFNLDFLHYLDKLKVGCSEIHIT